MQSGITGKQIVRALGCVFFCLLIGGMAFRNRSLGLEQIVKLFHGQCSFEEMKEEITSNYLSDRMRGQETLITLNGGYSRLLGKTRCNRVQRMNNGMLTTIQTSSPDLTAFEENLISLNGFLDKAGIPFFFISAPHKVPTEDQLLPAGVHDMQNQVLDGLLADLKEQEVPCVDLRPDMSRTADQVETYFYRTDHHWNAQGAFCAFGQIMKLIQSRFPQIKASYARSELWEKTILPDWWLGSAGRRVGPLFAGAEDLDLYLPAFDTDMARYTPGYWAYKGDFQHVNVREWFLENSDYFSLDSYDRYIGGNYPLTYHRNVQAENRMKILLIKDSFMMPVECFLSTEFTALDVIDPRPYDKMSIKDYITLNPPDLVIMLCYASSMELADYQDFGRGKECISIAECLFESDFASVPESTSSSDYLAVPLPLEPGGSYQLEIGSVTVLSGDPEGFSAVLYCGEERLDETVFDPEYGNLYGFHWGFRVPEGRKETEDYELRLYSGVAMNTDGIELLFRNVRINRCILSED